MDITYEETKRLLWLVRKEQRNDKVWPLFKDISQLKSLEQKLLEWLNNGAR